MHASSTRTATVAAACVAGCLSACDAVLGLGNYRQVPCAFDCADASAVEAAPFDAASADVVVDQTVEAAMVDARPDVAEGAAMDAIDDEGAAVDVTPQEGGPTPAQTWVHWPMPNPDATIGGDSSTLLPNPMAYEGGADAGVVRDAVTGLLWQRTDGPAADIAAARSGCASLGSGWRVPTRIELASLIDFTRSPTIDTATFVLEAGSTQWTASAVAVDAAPDAQPLWTVSFDTGLVDNGGSVATAVRCVCSEMQCAGASQ